MGMISKIRQQYPQYDDMSDAALADAFYSKFYADMPRAEFDAKMGISGLTAAPQPQKQERGPLPYGEPPGPPVALPGTVRAMPQSRTGDSLKPLFGGHNPIAETLDVALPALDPSSDRPMSERVRDTAAFVGTIPSSVLKLPTPGQALDFWFNMPATLDRERSFVENNPDLMKGMQAVGEIAPGATRGLGQGAASSSAVPKLEAPPVASALTKNANEATKAIEAFDRTGVQIPPGAFSSTPVKGLVKSLGETPIVGKPIDNAIERSYQGINSELQSTAGRFGDARTPREAGTVIEKGIERFKDARPQDVADDSVRNLDDAQLSQIIAAPTAETSLKTKQGALYERAWRSIPQEMQRGRSVKEDPRVMQNPANTRAVLADIVARNARMTVQTGPNAVTGPALNPVQGGLLGKMIEAVQNRHWTANLQTLRDMRSEFRRLASGMGDTEKNVLKAADLSRIQMGISQDMIALLERNAQRYREAGDVPTARGFDRAIHQFKMADQFTALSVKRLEHIEKLFKANSVEQLARNVVNSTLSGTKGDFDLLRTLHKTLRPEEMNEVRSAIVSELGRPVGSARGIVQETGFSAQSLLTRWQNMSDDAKAILFDGPHRQAIDDVISMASRLANVEAMANASRSGANAINVAGITAGLGMMVHGDIVTPLAILGGSTGLSYLLSRPGYARWAAQMLKLRAQAAQSPAAVRNAITQHIAGLAKMAERDPDLAPVVTAVRAQNESDWTNNSVGMFGAQWLEKKLFGDSVAKGSSSATMERLTALDDEARALGIKVLRPDTGKAYSADFLATEIPRLEALIAKARAEHAAPGPAKTSVPIVETVAPRKERAQAVEAVQSNPYVQAIKGRQGLPTKEEQIALVNKYFDKGGRFGPEGPWGRDVHGDVRKVLEQASVPESPKSRAGPANDMPSVGELSAAYQRARKEADSLRAQLEEQKKLAGPEAEAEKADLLATLKSTQRDVAMLQFSLKQARYVQDVSEEIKPRNPPRIYGGE